MFLGGLEEGWEGARSAGLLGWLWDDWREPGWAIGGGLGWIGLPSGEPLGTGAEGEVGLGSDREEGGDKKC